MTPTTQGPTGDVTFPGALGETIRGTVDRPVGPVHATAIFAHCFTCSRESHAASRISKALAERGIAVLRFDFTGLGTSEGEFADTSFTSNIGDLVAAAKWLETEIATPRLLVGHSLGGAAVIAAAGQLPEVEAVAVLGAPATPEHVAHIITGFDEAEQPEGDDDPVMSVNIGGRPFNLRRSFLTDIRDGDQQERIAALRRPLLVLHSPNDQTVGIDNAREIFEAARHPKSFIALDGADHLLTNRHDASYAAGLISTWASKYVDLPDVELVSSSPAGLDRLGTAPQEGVLISEADPAGFTHQAQTPEHVWLVDEPASVGGADLGPNPYEHLLAGLGACTSMTMRMYARRKGWEYGATTVTVTHNRVHAEDCDSCEADSGMIDVMHREIVLDPALPEDQRAALLKIADKCPVHRTLTGQIEVTTSSV
ncbi:bifunctional alpha/beta hydrolase/OsmC family protein [Nocardioides salsibiostraticola]